MKCLFFILSIFVLASCHSKFYDGEGNKLPQKAVRLLVVSQYCKIDSAEQTYLNRYFYANPTR